MSDERPSDVLGALPRRRPQRRSDKRPSRAAAASSNGQTGAPASGKPASAEPEPGKPASAKPVSQKPASAKPASDKRSTPRPSTSTDAATPPRPQRLHQPAQPPGVPQTPTPHARRPPQPNGRDIIGTAAQAAGELAEIGLSISARALRRAISRLPRP